MSQVFKRLGSVSRGEKSLMCKQGAYSWLHQWHLKSGEQAYFHAWSATTGVNFVSTKRQHERRHHTLHPLPPPTDCHPRHAHCSYNGLNPFTGSRRTMSILTDLLRRKKKTDDDDYEDEVIPDAKTLPLFDDTPKGLTDEEIEAKRNVSRLREYHQRLVHGQHPHTEPMTWIHHTVRYKQRMFGRYGESSGVNPGVLWPTREELKEKIEYEQICNPFTIQEMVEKKRALRKAEQEETEKRIKEVEAKMAVVDKFKKDLADRQEAKEREADEAKARREKLVEEVRRHFGYTVDPRDERFQELLAKKEKEQKKSMKEARKLEKQQKMLQKLEGKSAQKTKSSKSTTADKSEDKDDD